MQNGIFTKVCGALVLLTFVLPASAQDEEEKTENKNGLHFFHQYSAEHAFAEFGRDQQLRAKTVFSIMPIFGVGIRKETASYVFAFSSRFGFQRDNMHFFYAGKRLPGTYAMDYLSVKRQFAFGIRITPEHTFSFLFVCALNDFGMGTSPFGEKMNLRKLEQKDKLQLSTNEYPFLDYRLGFEYEFKPLDQRKLRFFLHLETSLRQRRMVVAPNYNLGINQPCTLFYRFSILGYGLRF